MTARDEHDLNGCLLCRLVEHLLEDRKDAVWRGDFPAAARLSSLIETASRGVS